MYSNPQKTSSDEVIELRHKAGQWLKKLREAQGLSQRQLAAAVGVEYYTFISQLETGRGRIPTDRCLLWAKALDVKPEHFVRTLMRYYDPVTYEILFEEHSKSSVRCNDANHRLSLRYTHFFPGIRPVRGKHDRVYKDRPSASWL